MKKVALALLVFTSCASTYQARVSPARAAYQRGDYDKAIELLDKSPHGARDELLYLLDKGMILQAAGRYKESNEAFTKAEDISDLYSVKSASREIAGTLWSEEAVEYAGDKHERVLIAAMRMLNYVMMDDWDGALVEVRHIRVLSEKVYGKGDEFDNAFVTYLAAVVWEALGHVNDALIDYKLLATWDKPVPFYANDIKRTSSRLGVSVKLPPEGDIAWTKAWGSGEKGSGEILVIIKTGHAPRYITEYITMGSISTSIPVVTVAPKVVNHAIVKLDGKEIGQTYPFYNIVEDIVDAVKQRQKRSLVRKLVKASVQTGLYTGGAELIKKDDAKQQAAGTFLLLLGLSMSAAEKADERSWLTLPAEFQLGRFYVPPGSHKLEIIPIGGGAPIIKDVEIAKGIPEVVLVHFPESKKFTKLIPVDIDRDAEKKAAKERELSQKVLRESSNGNAKVELAAARMGLGNYAVSDLIVNGLSQGGSRARGVCLLVIANAVSGNYAAAKEWAGKCGDEHLPDAGMCKFAAATFDYLAAGGERPDAGNVTLSKEENLTNGFNYFLIGLADEKAGDFEDASRHFAGAYAHGLGGDAVAKKVTGAFSRTSDNFKSSKEGVDIAMRFADVYLGGGSPAMAETSN